MLATFGLSIHFFDSGLLNDERRLFADGEDIHIDKRQYIIIVVSVNHQARQNMTDEEFLKRAKAVDDATRLKILTLLSNNGTMCACKILDELNITQGTLSHHMKILTETGFVFCQKEGKWCHYTLAKDALLALSAHLEGLARAQRALGSEDKNCISCKRK